MDTRKHIENLIALAKKLGVKSGTSFEKKFLVEWIRDECELRKMPPDEVSSELERNGLR